MSPCGIIRPAIIAERSGISRDKEMVRRATGCRSKYTPKFGMKLVYMKGDNLHSPREHHGVAIRDEQA